MKRYTIILMIIFIFFISCFSCVFASNNDTYELEFKTINNPEKKDFELYILLPEEYIRFAISESGYPIEYEGVNTVINNYIPGINVDKTKILSEMYEYEGVKYIQVLLEKNEKDLYTFDVLESYPKINIKYRIKNDERHYLIHIDNFKVKDYKCLMEYNYEENSIKQPDEIVIPKGIILLIIILIIMLIIGYIAKKKREYQ